jgi:hypothetical protein
MPLCYNLVQSMVSMGVAVTPFARKLIVSTVLAAGAVLPAMSAAGDRRDDTAIGFGSAGLSARSSLPKSSFGIKLLSIAGQDARDDVDVADEAAGSNVLRLYGDVATPTAVAPSTDGPDQYRPLASSFGVSWEHRLSARDSLSLAAEYGAGVSGHARPDTADARTGVSWTSGWGGGFRPSLTGSVFVGDETARDETLRYLERRYVGLSVGGQLNVFRDHTPYVALQYRRSYYDGSNINETLPLGPRTDDRSLFSAGWRWQVQPSMSLEAGASFGLNSSGQDLYNNERSRVFFGTRFDFQ